jgi:5-hydroxyisourate hydrolase
MPGISIHVVDVSRGIVASGMQVELHRLTPQANLVAAGTIGPRGTLDLPALDTRFSPGFFEARFAVADWYHASGIDLPPVPFLDVVVYRFGIADPDQHYHLPFKVTPWGFSLFRGGA